MSRPPDQHPKPPNRTDLLERSVGEFLKSVPCDLYSGSPILVAVSSGPDSICLLHVLHSLSGDIGLSLHVAHLHHGQREEGDADATFVEETARTLGVPFTKGREDVPRIAREERLSIEAAGRLARYRFFARLAGEIGARVVATGHHADDQAETVLLRALRGAGLRGLRGIPAAAPMPESEGRVTVIRPLLEIPRAMIEAYLEGKGISSRLDATNLDPAHQRNRIRRELLPLAESISPGARNGLLRIAKAAAEDDAALERWTDAVSEACMQVEEDRVCFRLAALPEERAIRRRLFRRGVELLLPQSGRGFPEAAIEQMMDAVGEGRRAGDADLAGGLTLSRSFDPERGETLLLVKRPPDRSQYESFSLPVELPGVTEIPSLSVRLIAGVISPEKAEPYPEREAWEAVIDADALVPPFRVRSWEPGDRMRVLGSGGTRKLQDLFTDARVPAAERNRRPLLCDAERIVWAPGIALHDAVKLTPATRRVLRLKIQPQPTSEADAEGQAE